MKPFDDILYEWLEDYGGKIPPNEHGGMEAMTRIAEALKQEGYSREDVKRKANIIIGHSVNESSQNYKGWLRATEKRVQRAIAKVYREEASERPVGSDTMQEEHTEPRVIQAEESPLYGKPLHPSVVKEPLEVSYDAELSKLLGYEDER